MFMNILYFNFTVAFNSSIEHFDEIFLKDNKYPLKNFKISFLHTLFAICL